MDGDVCDIDVDEGRMVWRVWPARVQLGRTFLALVLIFFTVGVVGFFGFAGGSNGGGSVVEGVLWGVLALVVFGMTLSSYFFPTEFVINKEGITAKYPMRRKCMRWRDVRRFAYRQGFGYLSTRSRVSRLDGYRGMSIRFGDDEENIVLMMREMMERSKPGG